MLSLPVLNVNFFRPSHLQSGQGTGLPEKINGLLDLIVLLQPYPVQRFPVPQQSSHLPGHLVFYVGPVSGKCVGIGDLSLDSTNEIILSRSAASILYRLIKSSTLSNLPAKLVERISA